MKFYTNVSQLIGGTPLLLLNGIKSHFGLCADIYAKLENFNPTGSIKDRPALSMIETALSEGKISQGATIIEPTSGNTGIGIASICASKGFKAILVMPDTMSKERIKLLKAYGAQVVLTDGKLGMQGCIEKANQLNKEIKNSCILGQFDNPANALAHYNTTAEEIINDLDGKIDYFVAGIGSAGTIVGCAKKLKENNSNIKIIGVEPASSPLISKGVSSSHKIQGIGANFVPSNYDGNYIDQITLVTDQDAISYAKLLACKEGIFMGISSGANLFAGVQLAKKIENKGKAIVVILPDSGDRYLSTELCD